MYPWKLDRLNAAFAALGEEEDREDPFLPPPPPIPGVETGGGITRINVGAGLPPVRQQIETVFGLENNNANMDMDNMDNDYDYDEQHHDAENAPGVVDGNCIALFIV